MEQINLGYSTKNIPVPSENTYLQMMVNSVEKLIHNLRWKSFFYLKPQSKSNSKETFGFKSTAPAPQVLELKNFENALVDMVKNIKFQHRPNTFQQKMNKDVKKIKKETRVLVAGDKSTNFHKMLPKKYTELLEKSGQMEYKKTKPQKYFERA